MKKQMPITWWRKKIIALVILSGLFCVFLNPDFSLAQEKSQNQGKAPFSSQLVNFLPEKVNHWFIQGASRLGELEGVQMLSNILGGSMMGPNSGWFRPGQTRYGWVWVAYHFDKNHDGKITPAEFSGPASYFLKLDRDHNGILQQQDFHPGDSDWTAKVQKAEKPDPLKMFFAKLDWDDDGVISAQEWEKAFEKLSGGKEQITQKSLAKLFFTPQKPSPGGKPGGPTREILIKGFISGELGSLCEGPSVGDMAPDFTLKTQDGKRQYTLSKYRGQKPVVLIFGSFT